MHILSQHDVFFRRLMIFSYKGKECLFYYFTFFLKAEHYFVDYIKVIIRTCEND